MEQVVGGESYIERGYRLDHTGDWVIFKINGNQYELCELISPKNIK